MANSVFKYPDTNSSRAGIDFLNRKFENLRIAIVGLGGTGSYVLDHLAKTPVKEIHLYDGDDLQLHNGFRIPGAIAVEVFERKLMKVNYLKEVYSNIHSGIVSHPVFVSPENVSQLSKFDYVFMCVDKNEARSLIINSLLKADTVFIDTGIGIHMGENSLIGAIRVTTGSVDKKDHINKRIGTGDFDLNEYDNNIQISDMNCYNAVMAVIRWKKIVGFYQDLKREYNSTYFLNTNKLLNEDFNT